MDHLAFKRFYFWCLFIFAFFSFQVIAEGANGPTTPAAEKVLIENNKLVIPVSFKYHNLVNSQLRLLHF